MSAQLVELRNRLLLGQFGPARGYENAADADDREERGRRDLARVRLCGPSATYDAASFASRPAIRRP
jgi:hypothetical protein